MPSWRNWSRTLKHRGLAAKYRPSNLGELQRDVRDARSRRLKLRAVGSGHSWSQLGLPGSNAAILRTDKLDRLLDVDHAAMTVRRRGHQGGGAGAIDRIDGDARGQIEPHHFKIVSLRLPHEPGHADGQSPFFQLAGRFAS